jgi:hypothetical protein
MMYNADTQGRDPQARGIIMDGFFRMIVRPAAAGSIPEDAAAHKELLDYTQTLELLSVKGDKHSCFTDKIDGVTYKLNDNPMGITAVRFDFTADGGVLSYTNDQGDKEISFGLSRNEFGLFPQDGYPDDVATVSGDRRFACAASAAWVEKSKLHLKVQIIDRCFGVLDADFAFQDDCCSVVMNKTAEDFLHEYCGQANGFAVK